MDSTNSIMDRAETSPYDEISTQWDAHRRSFRPGEQEFLDAFAGLLGENSRVLDLGCGTGQPNATHLVSSGHQIHGVDASRALLGIAGKNLPGQSFEQADIRDYLIPEQFDGVIAWDSLFHLRREEQTAIFIRLAEALPSGAPFLLTSGGSAQDPFSDTMWGTTFHYDAHPPHMISGVLNEAGFEVTTSTVLEKPAGGRNKGRIAVLARRR